ncbi:MAG: hypothetical protein QOK28_672 [Actinomycetota bacterium]|jgi:Tol biopolymer transport system component
MAVVVRRARRLGVAVVVFAASLAAIGFGVKVGATPAGQNGVIAFGAYDAHNTNGGSTEIFTINPDGSNLHQVTWELGWGVTHPMWSGDGRRIAYHNAGYVSPGPDERVGSVDADGGNRRWDFTLPTNAASTDLEWSPDGTVFAYGNSNQTITLMRADGSGATHISLPAVPGEPRWSPDGSSLAFATPSSGNAMWIVNTDGSDAHAVTSSDTARIGVPSFSPDGTHLAFDVQSSTSDSKIDVMNVDGSGRHSITTPDQFAASPTFSPDGTQIAFLNFGHISVMDADGQNPRQLTDIFGAGAPEWQPLGRDPLPTTTMVPTTSTSTSTTASTTTTTASTTTTIANQPPVPVVGLSTSGRLVAVSGAKSTDSDGSIKSYTWHWGDGASTIGRQASHQYAAPGTYAITLTVVDDKAAAAMTQTWVRVQ